MAAREESGEKIIEAARTWLSGEVNREINMFEVVSSGAAALTAGTRAGASTVFGA